MTALSWHRVAPLLRDRGHEVVAVDRPATAATAGLDEYAAAKAEAAGRLGRGRRKALGGRIQETQPWTMPRVANVA
jgi:hypothetical protein